MGISTYNYNWSSEQIDRSLWGQQLFKPNLDAPSALRVYIDRLLCDAIDMYFIHNSRVLDIGCGTGRYTFYFTGQKQPSGYRGIDIKQHDSWNRLIEPGRLPFPCHFCQLSAENIDALRTTFDFCLIMNCLLFINAEKFAQPLFKTMAPNSYVVISSPGPMAYPLYSYTQWYRYSPKDYTEIFGSVGFQVVQTIGIGGLPSFLLHIVWIRGLERVMRKLWPQVRVRESKPFKEIYRTLLSCSFRMDKIISRPHYGYFVILHKPEKS